MAPKDKKAPKAPTPKKPKRPRAFDEKWGPEVKSLGFTMVPSLLFKAQHRLGLSPTQLVVLLQLLDHWWDLDRHPWPAKERLSDKIGINPRQVQRVVAELQKGGFLVRKERYLEKRGRTSNEYNLSGLVAKLKKIAPEFKQIEDDVRSKRRAVVRRGMRKPTDEGKPA